MKYLLTVATVLTLGFGALTAVQAQPTDADPLGLRYGAESGLALNDPRVTTARIINIALGLLGVVAILIVLYAGFLWTTSAGNDEKVTEAKKMLWAGLIGLIIIFSAYTITRFVLVELYKATSGSYGRVYQP